MKTDYMLLCAQLRSLTEDLASPLPALANCAAMLWEALPDLNWCGFYLHDGHGVLLLGPFQGKTACTRIPFGKGVCGTAAASGQTQLVPDVHQFPGHIACDSASNSELVLPLVKEGQVLGVLDLDSPLIARFTAEDADGLRQLADTLLDCTDWSNGLL